MPANLSPLEQLKSRLAEGQSIPCLPPVLLGVQKAITDGEAGARELAHMLLSDPSLTARIIRLANSSYYASERKVRTVTSAIVLLGFEAVRNLMLGLTVYDMFKNLPRSFAYRCVWRHSLCCAVASRRFAEKLRMQVPEQAFVAGLLHDLGKLILGQHFAEQYAKVTALVTQQRIAWHLAEKEVLACTHMDAGRCLAEHWGFPPDLTFAIANHEFSGDPKDLADDSTLVKVVRVANRVASYLYEDDPRDNPASVAQIQELCQLGLGITATHLLEIFGEVKSEVSECGRALNIAISEWSYDYQGSSSSAMLAAVPAAPTADSSSAVAAAVACHDAARQKIDFLLACNELAAEASDFSQFVRQTVPQLFSALNLESFLLLFKDPLSQRLEAKFGYGKEVSRMQSLISIHLETTDDIAAAAFLSRKTAVVQPENLHLFSRIKEGNLIALLGTSKIVALPVLLNKEVAAVMIVARPQSGTAFDDTAVRLLSAYVREVSFVLLKTRSRKDVA